MNRRIEEYAEKKSLLINKYSRNDIRFVFSSFNAHSKHEIAKVITENIKNLPVVLPNKRKSHQPKHYSMSIFDAIALGTTHYYPYSIHFKKTVNLESASKKWSENKC
jgi:mitochondrial fission protein ELM1